MNPAQLLDHFDRISDAPDAVRHVRTLILALAVHGKLVEQDPNDEPASELVKQIQAEKAQLRKEEKKRKERGAPLVDYMETVRVPSGWHAVKAAELLTFVTSGSRGWAAHYAKEGSMFLRIGNLDYGTTDLDLSDVQRVNPPKGAEGERTLVHEGDILISITGDTGMVGLVPAELPAAYINQHIALARPSKRLCRRYLAMFFTSPPAFADLKRSQRGIKNSLGLEDIRSVLVLVPPVAEQHRIVAKVDELMALCDRLEGAQADRERRRDRLAAASLQRLNEPADAAAFREHVNFHLRHLARFTTRSDQVAALRQAILNLAVRGKLVPQDSQHESASELLKRIGVLKARFAGNARRRAQEPVAFGQDDVIPFQLRENWQWVRLGEVLSSSFYGPRFGADEYSTTGVPTIRTTDMSADGRIVLRDPPKVKVPADRLEDFKCLKGDLLITRTGSIGTMAVFNEDYSAIPSAYLTCTIHQ